METIRAHLTLVHVCHAYARRTHCGWPMHYPITSVRYGRIASVSAAHNTTHFGDSICPVCVSTFKCLLIQTQLTRALTDTGRATTLKHRILDQTTPLPSHPVFY
jgi:hypothetical protein